MADQRARHRLVVTGVVQGVGFRPFVYSLARRLGLAGSVINSSAGVVIEIEGPGPTLAAFRTGLTDQAPVLASIASVTTEPLACRGGTEFEIASSVTDVGRTLISADVATCADCLRELADPADRRHRHPFITCTNCGPRFTVITGLPYDRPSTTMADLPLCRTCADEYADPGDRRFHAQTIACPDCGPTLTFRAPGAEPLTADAALREARRLLATGQILAVKGIGGYHLACDAGDQTAVSTLRKRKDRGDKPFAIMVADLATATRWVTTTPAEVALLTDHRRPVVLLPRRAHSVTDAADGADEELAADVAPGASELGVMLPYTPLHRLLFGLPGDPPGPTALVMTSGNPAGSPIVTDDAEALLRLDGLADGWLSHDRPIHVACDDSVLRIVDHDQLPVRRSRGYAPLPIALPVDVPPTLAVGGDLKNTFCVGEGRYAWLSGHVGDMDDLATLVAFDGAQEHLRAVTGVRPRLLVADRHPGYRSHRWAEQHVAADPAVELITVQHHHAHVAAAMAENGHPAGEPVIGFAFDGTGYGDDGAVWGGEALIADYQQATRAAHLRYTWLPGGDAGVRNPCRMALSHLRTAGIDWDPRLPCVAAASPAELAVLSRQLETGLHCVPTSSMGRLFDAVSSLAGVCHRVAYEAEAAMRFEGLARIALDDGAYAVGPGHNPYAFGLGDGPLIIADPAPVLRAAAADVLAGVPAMIISARFHLAVADLVVAIARRLRDETGISVVALSGGVFLNVVLTRLCARRLREHDFRVLQHHQVPPSDAGLALGQLVIAAASEQGRSACA